MGHCVKKQKRLRWYIQHPCADDPNVEDLPFFGVVFDENWVKTGFYSQFFAIVQSVDYDLYHKFGCGNRIQVFKCF